MSVDNIDRLYEIYNLLSSAADKSKHQREYQKILDAAHGNDKEKKLAAQWISKYFRDFPETMETALDCQLDLCEDEDVMIRRIAIKELPNFCKDSKENTPKISDILAQLLNATDALEVQTVNSALTSLSKFDPLGTCAGLFSQISQGEEQTRLKCLQYVNNRFVKAGAEVFNKDVEELIIRETKKLLQDVSADEFQQCMQILNQTKLGKTITGHQELVKICVEQADLDAELESDTASEDEVVFCFLQCASEALPYCSSQIETTQFVKFVCEKFFTLTTWHLIGAADDQTQTQLRLLKVFAELCSYSGPLEKPKEKMEAIFNILLEYLPAPPLDADITDGPSILFSHVECLLYAIHLFGKQYPEYLTFPDDAGKMKDFRARLQYLARGTQGYVKKLQEEIKGKNSSDPKTEEDKLKVMGLKTTSNIQMLIRDLFHTPPKYNAVVRLSWVVPKTKQQIRAAANAKNEEAKVETAATPVKRHAPITFSNGNNEDTRGPKQAKKNGSGNGQQMYSPPGGKFSSKFGGGGNNTRGEKRFGGNRRFRGGNRQQGGGRRFGGGGKKFRPY